MNQHQANINHSHNELHEKVMSYFNEMLKRELGLEVINVELDINSKVIRVFIHVVNTKLIPCPQCGHESLLSKSATEKVWMYYSLYGLRTYIHAEEIKIDCPKHRAQFIPPPWDKQINEKLELSVL